jgi:hypothetical protein
VSDPRFDARYQRGYVAPPGESAAPQSVPVVRTPEPEVAAVPVRSEPVPEPAPPEESAATPETAPGRDPFRIALVVLGVALLVTTGAFIQQITVTESATDPARQAFLQLAQQLVPVTGFGGFSALIAAIALGAVRRW